MKTRTIRQAIIFPASPEAVYHLLLDAKALTDMHGAKAVISRRPRGRFSVFDGYCTGHHIDLVPGKKIIQAWHFKEEGWPKDHDTQCTFSLTKVPKGTKLTFLQKGVPESKVRQLSDGWIVYFWFPMLQYLLT